MSIASVNRDRILNVYQIYNDTDGCIHKRQTLCKFLRGLFVSVNFGCFAPSRRERYHCNAMRKAIEAP